MFSYVFMKILEGRPRSYDRWMNRVSRGRVRAIKEAVAAEINPGDRILEIGCGTGELSSMMIARGAVVDGFDCSPAMLEVAEERIRSEGLGDRLSLLAMGVEGMDGLQAGLYDTVVSTLVLSELGDDERRFALRQAYRALRPGGRVVIADEVVPRTRGRQLLLALARVPLTLATYLVARAATRPIPDLAGDLAKAGITLDSERRSHADAFALVVGRKESGP